MTDWQDHPDRPCARREPDDYFPNDRVARREAAELCAGCPVATECLEYAMRAGVHGIWGGTTEQQRFEAGGALPKHRGRAREVTRVRPRTVVPECGTESGYQRHRARREDCARCRAAHAKHEREKAHARRLAQIEQEAS